MSRKKKIANEILAILDDCKVEGNILYLPQQLDRKTYEQLDKVIKGLGGKWNRKSKGHVFDSDPSDSIDEVLLTGEFTDLKQAFQYFPTPKSLAKTMMELADIQPSDRLLEPSAGQGGIADFFPPKNPKTLVELNDKNVSILKEKGYQVHHKNFLDVKGIVVDKILMNPPFTNQQDVDHVLHAFSMLQGGGTMVAILSESPFFRTNKKSVRFREFLEEHNAEVHKLPDGTFKESGTMVNSRMIVIRKSESLRIKKNDLDWIKPDKEVSLFSFTTYRVSKYGY